MDKPKRTRFRKKATAMAGVASVMLAGVALKGGPVAVEGSSHREAPLISGDPQADNTDVYAFVSPDAPDTVTMIANWIPFEEPNGGPNFYPWGQNTKYNIKIDNDGDALPDLTYTWMFTNHITNPGTFLYNTGPVTTIDDADLNFYQTYDLTLSVEGGATTTLLDDVRAAPSLVGPGSIPNYQPLVDGATHNLPGGGKSYAGQADDPFYLDLRVFDLLYGGNLSEVGQDTLAGYNVNAIAIQVPKTAIAGLGMPAQNPVVGIWSTTDRRTERTATGEPTGPEAYTQVSRLGNPLVNEVVFPLALKDAFNSIPPHIDATVPAAVDAVTNPLVPPLIEAIYGIPAPPAPRYDLQEIFLQGVSADNAGLGGNPATVLPVDLNGHDLNTNQATLQPSEQLRLNMSIAPSATPNRLGLLAGQTDGFPNGRRLGDDVIDIALQVVEGAAISGIVEPLKRGDFVDRNDKDFKSTFPYLALPHNSGVNTGPVRPPRTGEFVPVGAERVLDTRLGAKPAAGAVVQVDVTSVGKAMVPDDAKAVAVRLTSTDPTEATHLTAYDCDDPRPNASNVNTPGPGPDRGNVTMTGISAAGKICIFTNKASHILADVIGYVPSTSVLTTATPERLLETRAAFGQIGYSGPKPTAGQTLTVDVGASAQVPDGTKAVFVNATSVGAAGPGHLTVYACDDPKPTASVLNYNTGDIVPNLVIAPLSDTGTLCVYTHASSDVLIDLIGVVPSSSEYVGAGPTRILETRTNTGGQVGYTGGKPVAGQVLEVNVPAVPQNSQALWLNITSVDESATGSFTLFPCGTQQPLVPTGNFRGSTTANLSVIKPGDSGRICIQVSSSTHLVADLMGHMPGIGITGG